MGAYEAGQAFLAGVLAKLPAEAQAQARAVFEAPEATDALTVLGDGALARSDYSRQQDALAARQRELDDLMTRNQEWWTRNSAALTEYVAIKPEYDALKTSGAKPAAGGPPPSTPAYDPDAVRKTAAEEVNAATGEMLNITAWASTKALEHYQTFGEVLNTGALFNAALQLRAKGQPVTLDDVYQQQYGERLAEKQKAAADAKFETEVQRRLADERAKNGGSLPFPTRTEPSALDLLGKTNPAEYSVDAAAAEYLRLQQARSA